MIKITDRPDCLGLTSLKRFECPKCKTTIRFRMCPQLSCYKCGNPLLNVTELLKDIDYRVLYYKGNMLYADYHC
jgi:hypothetical protein